MSRSQPGQLPADYYGDGFETNPHVEFDEDRYMIYQYALPLVTVEQVGEVVEELILEAK